MSKENVEIVRELIDTFQPRDNERAFDFYDPEIEWDSTGIGEIIPDMAGVYGGHEGVRTFWRRWLSSWKDIEFEVEDLRDAGDDVVALFSNQRQWERHSGIATEIPAYGMVFTIRGGKVVRWRQYPDHKSALEAAGLSE